MLRKHKEISQPYRSSKGHANLSYLKNCVEFNSLDGKSCSKLLIDIVQRWQPERLLVLIQATIWSGGIVILHVVSYWNSKNVYLAVIIHTSHPSP